ncbi:MAG: nucleoside triphosphate hydrolase [Candidatus Obscuribacter sp.]|nr:nucleoside triphosphate hydrolase [Candidatus Obscuribacter sp.]
MAKTVDHPSLSELTAYLFERVTSGHSDDRFMLGIAGPPGAGKSTAADALVREINDLAKSNGLGTIAVVAPMDGFHRFNAELVALNLRELKGVPDSFDSELFVSHLTRLRELPGERTGWPTFDRAIEEPTIDGTFIEPAHQIVIVEGNYLLLDKTPWDKVRHILDQIWYIDCDVSTIEPRLIERHMQGGKTKEGAKAKVDSTDLPNARLIDASKVNACRIIQFPKLTV